MTFAVTEAQTMLADMVEKLLASENDFETRRHRLASTPPQRLALWPHLAEQGILGAPFTEEVGGFGGTMRDLAVLMYAVGTRLVVEPVLANAVCGRILATAGDLDALAGIIAGARIFAFAHSEGFDPFVPPASKAVLHGNAYTLSGEKLVVRHADLAGAFIVTATSPDGPGCFLIEANAAGISVEAFRLIDGASAATVTFSQTPASLLAGEAAMHDALLWSIAGLAAEVTGILAALNTATFAYLGTRKQFGLPLAAFQALQHRCADMYAASEETRALTDRLICAIDESSAARLPLASAVKALADDAGRRIGHEAVQMHGGMGVSDELNVSHYMRRLAAIRAELGSADLHRARFAGLTEDPSHAA